MYYVPETRTRQLIRRSVPKGQVQMDTAGLHHLVANDEAIIEREPSDVLHVMQLSGKGTGTGDGWVGGEMVIPGTWLSPTHLEYPAIFKLSPAFTYTEASGAN